MPSYPFCCYANSSKLNILNNLTILVRKPTKTMPLYKFLQLN